MPSGLDFEAAGDFVVPYFVSNYLLRRLRVTVNMMWALFCGKMRKQSKERPLPSLADLKGAPPMGPFSGDYGTVLCVLPSQ